jgi:hypothetical protein
MKSMKTNELMIIQSMKKNADGTPADPNMKVNKLREINRESI